MTLELNDRLQTEVSLLQAIYPEVDWVIGRQELTYSSNDRSFQLRIPDGYLSDELPEVLSASIGKTDARERLRNEIRSLTVGEEVLDLIVTAFREYSSEPSSKTGAGESDSVHPAIDSSKATVIIWLHHLLNTNKRKQAVSPNSSLVSGVTKPGYPGVLIYSGPADAVNEHVKGLKGLNWQAFQIRLECDEEWIFRHGAGVKEVESMTEIVSEIGEENKQVFMEAMRMK